MIHTEVNSYFQAKRPPNAYFGAQTPFIGWKKRVNQAEIKPWKPEALNHTSWPPDYRAVYAWRLRQLAQLRANPELLKSAKAYYRTRNAEFIMHWMDTYDPRREGVKWIPFVFFERQDDFILYLNECVRDNENGLTEKARDMGATWACCAWSVHAWLFEKNMAIGWGSRKQELVDKLGDPSSIFEKMRLMVRRLPDIWRPEGLKDSQHLVFMKMINPENGSVITGETGDNIGRGGRTRIYFKDESAHYVRPELIEASLGDNTNTQIDISSVNGPGNVFHNKRKAGVDWKRGAANLRPGYTRVFIFDWKDHPAKSQSWYDTRKSKAEREGLQHLFAQEVDRNYSAALSNTIIPREWIDIAIDAHTKIKWRNENGNIQIGLPDWYVNANSWLAGLDVADGGVDRNALGLRQNIVCRMVDEWGERDPGATARKAAAILRTLPQSILLRQSMKSNAIPQWANRVCVQYDSIGVGAGVKGEYNRLVDDKIIDPQYMPFVGWNAGAAVVTPFYHVIPDDDQSPMNKDFFANFKAQAWWSLRTRFYKTYNNIMNGVLYDSFDEFISLDSEMMLLQKLIEELTQVTSDPGTSLKMVVNKQPDGTKSPNLADAVVMMYFPVIEHPGLQITSLGT